ncbi:MAG TPA: hypothetical protein VKH81_18545 [Candidatus Angelobacter sp.]|nr:hypothetical protein [Candidatus Angelobacter sp.]
MFRAYLNTLALLLGLSNFAVLTIRFVSGHAPSSRDFLIPAATLTLLLSVIFLFLKLMRLHDSRIASRALEQRSAQIADFKAALNQASRPEFSRGINSWNS